jgi:phosphopantetheine--protein transferase-like protein
MDDRSICISLSHSADWLACALASHSIGIDVEDTTRPRDTDGLAKVVLGPRELTRQTTMSASERRAQFFCHWTLKEAWIKQASNAQGMASIEFEPCIEKDAQAVVMTSARFALAVTPACPDALSLHGEALHGAGMAAWRRCQDR